MSSSTETRYGVIMNNGSLATYAGSRTSSGNPRLYASLGKAKGAWPGKKIVEVTVSVERVVFDPEATGV